MMACVVPCAGGGVESRASTPRAGLNEALPAVNEVCLQSDMSKLILQCEDSCIEGFHSDPIH